LAKTLREQGKSVVVALEPKSIGKWLEQANKQGAGLAMIQGSDERASGTWMVKNLNSGEQQSHSAVQLHTLFSLE
jgi:histidyl-tRNA synthetase